MLRVTLLIPLMATALLLQGCLKDHCTKSQQYKVYTPQYLPLAEARAMVGPEGPRPLKKTGKIFYHKGYLFIGEPDQGVHVIDDRNPAQPRNIGFLRIPGNLDIAVSGDILYADSYVDMVSFDVSNPAQVHLAGRTENIFPVRSYGYTFADDPEGKGMITGFSVADTTITKACPVKTNPQDVFYNGGQAYLAMAATPPSASTGANAESMGGSTSRFALRDPYLYAVIHDSLRIYDISSPAHPAYLSSLVVNSGIETIFSYGQHLFIGSSIGVSIFDASQPETPVRVSDFTHVLTCDPVVVQHDIAYATIRSGSLCNGGGTTNKLLVISIANPASPYLAREMELTNPGGLAVRGNDLVVTDGAGGIRFLDVSTPSNPHLVSTVKGLTSPRDVIMLDSTALVVAEDGLYQYNYQNMESPRLVSRLGASGK